MFAIKNYATIDLTVILCSFISYITGTSLDDVANQFARQQISPSTINITSSQQGDSMSNFYTNSQALKFRVNVSNICEKTHMRVTVRLSRPFYGLIHTKEKRKKAACQVEGTGEQTYIMEISYTLVPSDHNYCGVVSHQLATQPASNQSLAHINHLQQTLSVALVVRIHKSIEFSDDRYFLLSCANRCTRSDCSSAGPEVASSQLTARSSANRGFVASESIISPVLRASEPYSVGNSGKPVESPSNGWTPTERCDHLLDLKFQWLAKLCWALAILLIAMFCISYCLCLALNKNKSKTNKHSDKTRRGNRSHPLNKSACHSTKEILYPTQSSSSQSTDGHLVGSSWSLRIPGTDNELNKIREDNTYLGKQQQELILADLMSKRGQSIDRKQQHRLEPQQFMVLGRSAGPFNTSQRQNEPLEIRVKRRRSIGSSTTALPLETERSSRQLSRFSVGKLDGAQRAKSRSQTTIHYDQGQDPFKTVPFSYLNNGYISDGATSQRVYMGPITGTMDVHGVAPQGHQAMLDSQLAPVPIAKGHLDATPLSSQFDPQNSRQLIDLIQHKHWQQMAQADRTASTLQAIHRNPPMVPARSWR